MCYFAFTRLLYLSTSVTLENETLTTLNSASIQNIRDPILEGLHSVMWVRVYQVWWILGKNCIRALDEIRKINFNKLCLWLSFTKSYILPFVRIVSMRRLLQVVNDRILWRKRHYRNENIHLIWSPSCMMWWWQMVIFVILFV